MVCVVQCSNVFCRSLDIHKPRFDSLVNRPMTGRVDSKGCLWKTAINIAEMLESYQRPRSLVLFSWWLATVHGVRSGIIFGRIKGASRILKNADITSYIG